MKKIFNNLLSFFCGIFRKKKPTLTPKVKLEKLPTEVIFIPFVGENGQDSCYKLDLYYDSYKPSIQPKKEMNKQDFLKNITQVIETGETWKDKTVHLPARKAIEWIKEVGLAEVEDSFLSNGYAWDWWCSFTFNNNEYILGGSGYDGGLSFQKIND